LLWQKLLKINEKITNNRQNINPPSAAASGWPIILVAVEISS